MPEQPEKDQIRPELPKEPRRDLNRPKIDSWLSEAGNLFDMKNYIDVLDLCEKILKEDEKNIKALNLKGEALDHMGRFEEAITCYNTVLEINQNIAKLNVTNINDEELILSGSENADFSI